MEREGRAKEEMTRPGSNQDGPGGGCCLGSGLGEIAAANVARSVHRFADSQLDLPNAMVTAKVAWGLGDSSKSPYSQELDLMSSALSKKVTGARLASGS